jgi:hypothetical protein
MSELPRGNGDTRSYRLRRVRLARLEADLAYFQARIEVLGEPATVNQQAQRRAFTALYAVFAKGILAAREKRTQR